MPNDLTAQTSTIIGGGTSDTNRVILPVSNNAGKTYVTPNQVASSGFTTLINIGDGKEVYAGLNPQSIPEFRTIKGGPGVTVTQETNSVTIGFTKSSLGSGQPILSFTQLTDTPVSFGNPNAVLVVNSSSNGLAYAQLATVALTGSYNDLTNKPSNIAIPTLATVATTGSYADLANKPVFSVVATSGNFNDLTNKPVLATVAVSGNYNSLINRPTIPTIPNLATVATSGSYVDLINKPVIPTSPTLSTVAISGNYSDLSNKPVIPTLPTLSTVAISGSYTDLINKPISVSSGALATLTDVVITSLQNGQVLQWDTASAKFINATVSSSGAVSLNSATGTLGVANGGTGRTTLATNGILFGNGVSQISIVAAPTLADTYLHWSGSTFEWATVTSGGSAGTFGTTPGTYAQGNDPRFNNSLQKSANLSDLASAASARVSLGLAAVAASGAYTDLTGAPVAIQAATFIPYSAVANGSIGVSTTYARGDHAHPSSTTLAPINSPTFTGTVTIPVGAAISGYATVASLSTYALTANVELLSRKGIANGYASLDANGKIPSSQISTVSSATNIQSAVQVVTVSTTALANDGLLLVTPASAITITLESNPATGTTHFIKDGNGTSTTNNITIDGGGKTIDGVTSFVINQNRSSVTLIFNGTEWSIV